jgi:pimeloyl-ACP methyl ester carboxylesterase
MTQLVLIPGLAGDAVMWRAQLAGLRDFAAVVTDVHTRHATIPNMATALLAEHEGPLVLCGASMGGMIAMEAAHQAPERITGLALLGTTARPENEEMRKLRETAIGFFEQGRVAEVIEPNVRFAFHPESAMNQQLVDDYVEFVMRAGAQQLIRQNRAVIARPDAREHLPRLRCPVIVMHGDSDGLVPFEHATEIASLLTNVQLFAVPQCGHMLTMEQPAFVNATLARWLGEIGI